MLVQPGEHIQVPGKGQCTVLDQDSDGFITLQDPDGEIFLTGSSELVSEIVEPWYEEMEGDDFGGRL